MELAADSTHPVWTCVLCLDKFRKKVFPPIPIWHKNGNERKRRIAWCADKGEPSEGLATHHTAAVVDSERREALIKPDSTRWNSAAQSRQCLDVCMRQASTAAPAAVLSSSFSLFWVWTLWFQEEKCDWWGPVMGSKVGCWKREGRWVWSKYFFLKKTKNKPKN